MKLFHHEIKDEKFIISLTQEKAEIDFSTTVELSKILNIGIDQGYKEIYFDFKNLNFIDSSGLGRLIAASKKIKIIIMHCPEDVKKIFHITHLTTLFTFI